MKDIESSTFLNYNFLKYRQSEWLDILNEEKSLLSPEENNEFNDLNEKINEFHDLNENEKIFLSINSPKNSKIRINFILNNLQG
jgi:hypothetical protein